MKICIKAILMLSIFLVSSCVSVSYLPTDEVETYIPTPSVKVFWEEPEEPHLIIGKLSIESGDYSEEELFKQLKQKAKSVGAQGIIMMGTSRESSVVGVPVYGGGTLITPVTSTRLEAIAIRFKNN